VGGDVHGLLSLRWLRGSKGFRFQFCRLEWVISVVLSQTKQGPDRKRKGSSMETRRLNLGVRLYILVVAKLQ
jgi:hypothetical protein